jgi:hypothetical protein
LQDAPVAIGTAIVGDCEVRFEIFNEYLFDTATAFEFTHRCVDPGSPDGYGNELLGGTTPGVPVISAPIGEAGLTVRVYDSRGFGLGVNYSGPLRWTWEFDGWFNEELGVQRGWMWLQALDSEWFKWRPNGGYLTWDGTGLPDSITITVL